jgi:hypothetical protein
MVRLAVAALAVLLVCDEMALDGSGMRAGIGMQPNPARADLDMLVTGANSRAAWPCRRLAQTAGTTISMACGKPVPSKRGARPGICPGCDMLGVSAGGTEGEGGAHEHGREK